MAICEVTENILANCEAEVANGGMDVIYVLNSKQIDSVTVGALPDHTVTGVSVKNSANFIKFVGRFERQNLNNEMNRENYSRRVERVLNAFIEDLGGTNAGLLNRLAIGKLFVIVALNNKNGSNRKALCFGWDLKLENNAGAILTVGEIIEDSTGGQIGNNCVFTSIATETMRSFIGTIDVNDGSGGTETITFG